MDVNHGSLVSATSKNLKIASTTWGEGKKLKDRYGLNKIRNLTKGTDVHRRIEQLMRGCQSRSGTLEIEKGVEADRLRGGKTIFHKMGEERPGNVGINGFIYTYK